MTAARAVELDAIFAKSCEADGSPRWEMCMQHMGADEFCRLSDERLAELLGRQDPARHLSKRDVFSLLDEVVAARRALSEASAFIERYEQPIESAGRSYWLRVRDVTRAAIAVTPRSTP